MKNQSLGMISLSTATALFGLAQLLGCNGAADEPVATDTLAALTACHLNDGTVEHDALIRACDPQDAKKTTICHVPPGNPGNAHTLCIGNPAVPAHLAHHDGDHVGPCRIETRCPPPPGQDGSPDGGKNDQPRGKGGSCGHDAGGTGGATVIGTGGNSPDGGFVITIL